MSEPRDKSESEAPFAYAGLERVIHEKARLGILASLVNHGDGLAFSDLKQLCALTDGNLNRHLQVLQDAGLVEVRKASSNNRPQTLCLESKSLKIYLSRFRDQGVFGEALAVQIRDDVAAALALDTIDVNVTLRQKARGGITITATV